MKPGRVERKRSQTEPFEWAVAIAATVAAIALTVVFAAQAGALWRDEVNSVNTQRAGSLRELWRLEEFESFPLLWVLLLKGWTTVGLGSSDSGLRAFGALGALTLPAAVWFAARRFSHRVPLVSLALLAINPEVIRWATSVRAWSLGASLAVVAVVLILEMAAGSGRRRTVIAGLVAVASVQCVYQNVVFVAAAVLAASVVAVRHGGWLRAMPPLGVGVAAGLSLVPYVDVMFRRGEWNMLSQVPVTLADLAARAEVLFGSSGGVVLVCWLAFTIVAVLVGGVRLAPCALALVGSIAGLAAFYLGFKYPTQPWYYVGLAAVVATTAEAALVSARPTRALRLALSVLAAIVLVTGLQSAWVSLQVPLTNMNLVAARLSSEAAPDDVILVHPWHFAIALDRYYQGGATVLSIPPIEDHRVHRFDLVKAAMLSSDALAPVRARVQRALESGHRVWVVGSLDAPPNGATVPALPKPPLPKSGWNSLPYEIWWSLQTGAFLQQHAISGRRITLERAGGWLEDASLVVLSGWREPKR